MIEIQTVMFLDVCVYSLELDLGSCIHCEKYASFCNL